MSIEFAKRKVKSTGKKFEYDVLLVPEDNVYHPSLVFLLCKETNFRYVPAQIDCLSEDGVIHGLKVPFVRSHLMYDEVYIQNVPATDLKLLSGLIVHTIPKVVSRKGRPDIELKGIMALNEDGYTKPQVYAEKGDIPDGN